MPRVPRAIVFLGLVSLFTDASSEMIYPLLPAFLAGTLALGRTAPAVLGLIEGAAESTAAILKIVSGVWSDRLPRRKPLVVLGYGLSSLFRPLIGLATVWPVVFALRLLDRVGKGIRSSPRDALIADTVDPSHRGAAYGLHRAMDHAGALIGPLIAAALLSIEGVSMRTVFLLAAVPAALAMAVLIFGVREPARGGAALRAASEVRAAPDGPAQPAAERAPPLSALDTDDSPPSAEAAPPTRRLASLRSLTPDFRRFLLAIFIFTLGNSTDAFLLLRLGEAGLSPAWVAGLWSIHHAVKMASTYLGGALSDALGRRALVLAGWLLYVFVYASFAIVDSTPGLIALFLIYGIFFGLTEPTERGWVADLAATNARGAGFGWYHLAVGLAALPASALFGLLWRAFGHETPFLAGAALALIAASILWRVPDSKNRAADSP